MYAKFCFCLCLIVLCISTPCLSDILIVKRGSNKTIEVIGDLPALFGPPLPLGGLKGYVVYTLPHDACVRPLPPPKIPKYNGSFIALVRRYNCTFVDKVLNAQNAGYQGVIVRNVGSNSVEVMSGDHDVDLVKIPSVFIGQDDGLIIQDNFQFNSGYYAVVTDELPFNIQNYLLPFAITIGICFILMLTLMLLKCIRDYRRGRRHRLSSGALKKLPIHKFKKGDPYECCAVCLEDYVDNEKLRILPCGHAYHSKCIDPWLTKNRRVCPVCKRKVITGDERPSDLESDSDDERALLINSEGGTQGGTFNQQRENPFQEAERQAERRRQEEWRGRRDSPRYPRRNNSSYSRLDEAESQSSDTDSEQHHNEARKSTEQSSNLTQTENDVPASIFSITDPANEDILSSSTEQTKEEKLVVAAVSGQESEEVEIQEATPKTTSKSPNDCIV